MPGEAFAALSDLVKGLVVLCHSVDAAGVGVVVALRLLLVVRVAFSNLVLVQAHRSVLECFVPKALRLELVVVSELERPWAVLPLRSLSRM